MLTPTSHRLQRQTLELDVRATSAACNARAVALQRARTALEEDERPQPGSQADVLPVLKASVLRAKAEADDALFRALVVETDVEAWEGAEAFLREAVALLEAQHGLRVRINATRKASLALRARRVVRAEELRWLGHDLAAAARYVASLLWASAHVHVPG